MLAYQKDYFNISIQYAVKLCDEHRTFRARSRHILLMTINVN